MAKAKDIKIDGKGILKMLAAGFQTQPTKRGGKPGFVLIQRDKRTLAMASIRKDGAIRLEGSRIGKSLRVETAAEIGSARKQLEEIAKANERKAKEAKAGATAQPQGRPSGKSVAAKRVESIAAQAPSGNRARARAHARSGVNVVAP